MFFQKYKIQNALFSELGQMKLQGINVDVAVFMEDHSSDQKAGLEQILYNAFDFLCYKKIWDKMNSFEHYHGITVCASMLGRSEEDKQHSRCFPAVTDRKE